MKKKSNRGITLISLTVYIVILATVIAILATFKGKIDDTLDSMSEYTSATPEFNKMHLYMLEEVNLENNKVIKRSADGSYIEFSSGNAYLFDDNKVFRNNVKIFSEVDKCSFKLGKENDNDVLYVEFSIDNQEYISKELKYVVNDVDLVLDDPYKKIGISIEPDKLTSGSVEVSFTKNVSNSDLILNYQIGSKEKDGWSEYTGPIVMQENGKVYAVLANTRGVYSELDIVEAVVDNIDKVIPNMFNLGVTVTSNSITVSGHTTDVGSNGVAPEKIGIRGYQYRIDGGNWTAETTSTSCVFGNLSANTQHTVSMRAIDKAGNIREATNKDYKVTLKGVPDSEANIDISYSTTNPTNEPVIVYFRNNSGDNSLILKYQEDVTTGEWLNYPSTGVTISTNKKVYAKLFDSTNQSVGTATATVTNIDYLSPKVFQDANINTTVTTNSIKVTGSTTDEYTTGCASTNYGVSGYQFILKNSAGTEIATSSIQSGTSYTFNNLTQGTTYLVSIKAIDKAGNETTSKDISVRTSSVADSSTKIGISYSTTNPTNQPVTVTFKDNSGVSGLTLKYQIGSTSGNWTKYSSPISISTNQKIYARLFDSTGQTSDTTATATVSNIDKVAPTVFITTQNSGTSNIIVTANAKDTEGGMATSPTYNYYLNGALKKSTTEKTYTITGVAASSSNVVKVTVADIATNLGTKEVTVSNSKHTSHTVNCYLGETHTHSGNANTGGACYTPKYHAHSGNTTSGGACYTSTGHTHVNSCAYNIEFGSYQPYQGFPVTVTCKNCGTVVASGTNAMAPSTLHCGTWACGEAEYKLSCTKTTSTIDSYTLSCGKTAGTYYAPIKHAHSGNTTSGGECYQTAVYHQHSGNSTSGGECYTYPLYHIHTRDCGTDVGVWEGNGENFDPLAR